MRKLNLCLSILKSSFGKNFNSNVVHKVICNANPSMLAKPADFLPLKFKASKERLYRRIKNAECCGTCGNLNGMNCTH